MSDDPIEELFSGDAGLDLTDEDIAPYEESIDEKIGELLALMELLKACDSTGLPGDTLVPIALEEYQRQQAEKTGKR